MKILKGPIYAHCPFCEYRRFVGEYDRIFDVDIMKQGTGGYHSVKVHMALKHKDRFMPLLEVNINVQKS